LFVKSFGVFVNSIYNYGIDCDLITDRQRAFDCIGQQHFSNPLPLSSIANRQSADQSSGHWMLRQLLQELRPVCD